MAPRETLDSKSKRSTQRSRRYRENDPEFLAAQREAERREQILADRRRVEAKWRPKIPEVRRLNFENFKNRFHDVEEPDYAIEVLMAGSYLQAQVRREQALRRKEDHVRTRQHVLLAHGLPREQVYASRPKNSLSEKVKRDKKAENAQMNEGEMQRIRIQSQPVLGHLTSLLKDTELRSTPRTFVRPFKALVYFQPKMKEILATLEEKWADYEEIDEVESVELPEIPDMESIEFKTKDSGSEAGDDDDDNESLLSVDSNAEDLDTIMDSPEALRDMRCYVNFIDKEVMPQHNRFSENETDKVKFEDLWSLFRPGDLIYMPAAGETAGRYHEVWRIYRTEMPEVETSYPLKLEWEFFPDESQDKKDDKFNIYAYYIDHDGDSFGAVRHTFEIESFVGERLVESLEVFPIRYRQDHRQLLDSLKKQGKDFQRYLGDRHQSYHAWTLTRNPPFDTTEANEEILDNESYEKMRHPEFVESDVIVDLQEAYQKHSGWRPSFHRLTVNKSIACEVEDDGMGIQQWFDASRTNLAYSQTEIVQKREGVELWQRRENLNIDTFLRQRTKGSRTHEMNPEALELREEDLVLLPKRMFAYALRERRFVPVNIQFLKPIRREQGVFENLKILKDYKDIVRGLVASHFQKKSLERRYVDMSTEGPGQDLIQNKGRGLVVLLHGVPGVGKTATAEAVAMEYRKPLFVITCGDLGLTPSEVEYSLNNVFRLANLWDCVLLLDEADVFLSQRSKVDMKRNALVSVFLRVLEYYNGLLFLTTNRVNTIDEAFKSRIHMSLYYPPLDKTQTQDIFRLNLAKLREIESQRHTMTGEPALVIRDREIIDFAGKHYEENARSTGCWNGRQIRNAFQIASSLAHHNYTIATDAARANGQQPPMAPVLDRSLFDKVQMSTLSFDHHMKESKGFDSELPLRNTFYEEGRFE
ncbi:putative aaa family protein [Daldinia childiae]|nr:putative aaa family protein [Daldinia childiae]KAF3064287.1 putative aaa family protein [Daldinia childiae]